MSLRVWLPLNGTLDNLGISELKPVQTTAPSWVTGKIGSMAMSTGAFYLPAVEVSKFYNNDAMSFAFWIYPKGSGSSPIIGQSTMTKGDNRMFTIYQYPNPDDLHYSWQSNESSSTFFTTTHSDALTMNAWNHVVVVYDGSALKVKTYINGVLTYTENCTKSPRTNFEYNVPIPSASTRYLNDVRIYNTVLSEKEIHDISKALILHYPLDNNGGGGINLLENSSMSVNLTNWVTSGFGSESGIISEDGLNCLKITGALTTTRYIRQDILSDILNDTVGTTYTISAYVKVKNVVKGTTNPMCEYYFGGSYNDGGTSKWMGATSVSGTYNFWTLPNGQWTKCVWTIRFAYVPTAMQFHVYSRDMTGTMYIKNIKMERGSIATGWSPSPEDLPTSSRNIVYDCSGYHNDGEIVGNPEIVSNTSRYNSSVYFPTASSPANAITSPMLYHDNKALTINIWGKMSSAGGHSYHEMIASTSPYSRYELGTEPNGQFRSAFYVNDTRYVLNTGPNVHDSKWHMFTLSYDGSTIRRYVDGVEYGSTSVTGTLTVPHSLDVGRMGTGTNDYWLSNAYVSDARVYATALSSSDVKELYNVGASVDNQYNIHTYDYIEDEYSDNPSIYKSGIVKARSFVENFSEHTLKDLYDTVYYTEPDGSKWIRIFHHNNPASKLFSSTNNFIDRVYIDADRWFDISICNYVSRWELMVKQKTTSSATETKYRWIQFVNPMIGTFNETKAADVIKITTSGYTNVSNAGGIIQGSSENTYMTINNGTSGNWYGAIGCWTAYNSGIPGYPNTVVTSGYMDLYLRIDDPGIYKEFISGNELIEI